MNPPPLATAPSEPKAEQDLRFDARNPRLSEDEDVSQAELLVRLWRDFAVDELALSIAANGFFPHEPLFAAEEDGELVVVEGNRRLAAVRLLRHASMRSEVGATDLPRISKKRVEELQTLPVVVCPRADIWQYVGFKHVNGPQAWRSHSKAQYIAWVHNELGVTLADIAKQIGDKHHTVRRLYRALMVLEQAEDADVFQVEDRAKKQFAFSHLYTGLDYKGFESFLGFKRETSYKPRPVPKRNVPQLGQLLIWLYGSKSREEEPLIRSQNPDLRLLDEVLLTKDGTAALKRGLGLDISHDIGRGDDALFREALLAARQSLQEARGKMLSGYEGERDLKRVAEDILVLAESIDEEMQEQQDSARRAKKVKRTTRRATRRK
ncbi:MAG TPA: ParB N-terminal domain-containing protein [Solirubrobacterales bacterium]|nr:ParB N-terminal domain-containing protein [Solirubrobacterales bacterium]